MINILTVRLSQLAVLYREFMRVTVLNALQYRGVVGAMLLSMVAEPLVSLVVWRTVATSSGGEVDGFTAGRFAAYYLTWTIVRQASQMTGTAGFQEDVRKGTLSSWLLRPALPLHRWMATILAWATYLGLLAVPIAGALAVVFRPELHTSPLQVVWFVVAFYGAAVLWAVVTAAVGYTSFWLVSIRAVDRLHWTASLLLSGRLVPVDLLPGWAHALSSVLWFRWGFDFPIQVLIGPIDGADIAIGLGMQAVWIVGGLIAVRTIWHFGVRRYGAVGG